MLHISELEPGTGGTRIIALAKLNHLQDSSYPKSGTRLLGWCNTSHPVISQIYELYVLILKREVNHKIRGELPVASSSRAPHYSLCCGRERHTMLLSLNPRPFHRHLQFDIPDEGLTLVVRFAQHSNGNLCWGGTRHGEVLKR